jgi:hypothetical protein
VKLISPYSVKEHVTDNFASIFPFNVITFITISLISLALHSSFSTQTLIQYNTVPLSTPQSKFSHSLRPSAFHNIPLPELLHTRIQTNKQSVNRNFTICPINLSLLLSLSRLISGNPLAAQFDITINLLCIYNEPCVFLSTPHSLPTP